MFNPGSFFLDILSWELLWLVLLISAILIMLFFYCVYWFLSNAFGPNRLSERKIFKKRAEAIIQALKKRYDQKEISQAQFESILKEYLKKP